MKDAERRDKVSIRTGKDMKVLAGPVKTFQISAMLKTAPLNCERKAT
jgi:hypothetical protein